MQSKSSGEDFVRLFVQHESRIYAFIRSLVFQTSDAEDLLQETAATLWQKYDGFRPGTDFLAWALQTAHYQVLSFRHRQRRDRVHFSNQFIDAVGADTMADVIRLGELQELVDMCLERLPLADRELLRLRGQPGVSIKTVAEKLGQPLSTVYHAISRIRQVLARTAKGKRRREKDQDP
jgi:RNA polymerase sigma-70 factor (ECF subfamily)